MTVEELRALTLAGLDRLQSHPVVWWSLSPDERKLVKAQRVFWGSASPEQMKILLALFDQQPETKEKPCL